MSQCEKNGGTKSRRGQGKKYQIIGGKGESRRGVKCCLKNPKYTKREPGLVMGKPVLALGLRTRKGKSGRGGV